MPLVLQIILSTAQQANYQVTSPMLTLRSGKQTLSDESVLQVCEDRLMPYKIEDSGEKLA